MLQEAGKKAGRARNLVCYWSVAESEMRVVELARKFGMTPAAISYGVQQGEKIAREQDHQLETRVI